VFEVGSTRTWERAFTDEDVRRFGELTGDRGEQHVVPGPDGRLMVQGLLTATLPTKIGGDMSFVAREMTFEFVRPVFTADRIRAEVTVRETHREGRRTWAALDVVCRNQEGKEVLRGSVRGFVLERAGA